MDEHRDEQEKRPNAKDAAIFYISLIAALILLGFVLNMIAAGVGYDLNNQVLFSFGIILQAVVTIALLAYFAKSRNVDIKETFRIKRCPPLLYVIGAGAVIPIGMLTGQAANILIQMAPDLVSEQLIEFLKLAQFSSAPGFALFLAAISVGPGISEELAFRGWVLRGVENSTCRTTAIWISAFVFSLFHIEPLQIILTFPAALFLGYLVVQTGSILPAMFAHALNNVWATIETSLFFSNNSEIDPSEIILSTAYPPEVVIAATAVLILALYGLHRYLEKSGESLQG